MAERKSFLFYLDWHQHLERLPADKVGKLVLALCDYSKSGNITNFNDGAMDMCFSFMIAQLQRDNEKYIETCRKRSEAGKKGAKQKQANANKSKQNKQKHTKQADTDIDTDIDTDTDIDIFKDVPAELKEAFTEYQKWRLSKDKGYRSRNAVTRAVNTLQKLAPDNYEDQTAIIYQALDGGYTEFAPLRSKSNKQKHGDRFDAVRAFAKGGC